jgi:uncharacterized sulfatase
MIVFKTRVAQIFYALLCVMGLYSIERLFFFVFNLQVFSDVEITEIFFSFIHGLRFDMATLTMLNIPIILLSLVPRKILPDFIYRPLTLASFMILNLPSLLANLGDIEYYKFTGRRSTAEIFDFHNEAQAQFGQFVFNYWHITLISIIVIFLFQYVVRKIFRQEPQSIHPVGYPFLFLAVIAFCVIGFRGGTQKKTIKSSHAYTSPHEQTGHLTLNTGFTLIQSFYNDGIKEFRFFESDQEAFNLLSKGATLSPNPAAPKDNVVILILESLATEFWGHANPYPGHTPFLDQLAKKSIFYKHHYANARRSIEALPAILFGIPSLMKRPLAISNYQTNNLNSFVHTLHDENYHTSFFHGAPKGTMYFDMIINRAGVQDYYPYERYPGGKEDFDGKWGIFDEPFLQFMASKLNEFPEPFFSSVFTISTHQPYTVPEVHKDRFPEGSLEIHKSVRYVDYSVEQFFKRIEKSPWFKNTLFIITADHTQMSESEHYGHTLGRFMVPLMFYHPTRDLSSFQTEEVAQHVDIFPTVLDYLGLSTEQVPLFGRSLWSPSKREREALLYLGQDTLLVRKEHYLQFNPNSDEKSYLFSIEDKDKDTRLNKEFPEKTRQMIQRNKAYLQYHHNGLIKNQLYLKK